MAKMDKITALQSGFSTTNLLGHSEHLVMDYEAEGCNAHGKLY